jgi:hypothetical protein
LAVVLFLQVGLSHYCVFLAESPIHQGRL